MARVMVMATPQLSARFNDGPLMNGEMCLEPLSALGRINGRQAVTGRSPAFADQQRGFDFKGRQRQVRHATYATYNVSSRMYLGCT